MDRPTLRFLFVSTCSDAWGGSEALWSGAALHLLAQGHRMQVLKTSVDPQHSVVRELIAQGCPVTDLDAPLALVRRVTNRVLPFARQTTLRGNGCRLLHQELRKFRPQLVVVSQGSNFDGIEFAEVCRTAGVPYVLIAQKAVEFFFPPTHQRELAQRVYQAARRCYFVSEHNRQLTQWQLGQTLVHSEVVRNPFQVPYDADLSFPAASALQLACVARLNLLDKGQDMLLQVLAQPQWQARPVHVTFFGSGIDGSAIADMARLLGVSNVTLAGQVQDIAGVWATHHALVLPSRSEGLPLALVEAMLCGRPAILTPAGGNTELVLDNETGFLATATNAAALGEALERAWQQRARWAEMGRRAAAHARAAVPPDPARLFAQELLAQLQQAV